MGGRIKKILLQLWRIELRLWNNGMTNHVRPCFDILCVCVCCIHDILHCKMTLDNFSSFFFCSKKTLFELNTNV